MTTENWGLGSRLSRRRVVPELRSILLGLKTASKSIYMYDTQRGVLRMVCFSFFFSIIGKVHFHGTLEMNSTITVGFHLNTRETKVVANF